MPSWVFKNCVCSEIIYKDIHWHIIFAGTLLDIIYLLYTIYLYFFLHDRVAKRLKLCSFILLINSKLDLEKKIVHLRNKLHFCHSSRLSRRSNLCSHNLCEYNSIYDCYKQSEPCDFPTGPIYPLIAPIFLPSP